MDRTSDTHRFFPDPPLATSRRLTPGGCQVVCRSPRQASCRDGGDDVMAMPDAGQAQGAGDEFVASLRATRLVPCSIPNVFALLMGRALCIVVLSRCGST